MLSFGQNLINTREFAQLCGRNPETIRRALRENKIVPYGGAKLGRGGNFFDLDDPINAAYLKATYPDETRRAMLEKKDINNEKSPCSHLSKKECEQLRNVFGAMQVLLNTGLEILNK